LNGNGAGDAFTAGFLVAAMLRHTGMAVLSNNGEQLSTPKTEVLSPERNKVSAKSSPLRQKNKLTPYSLYMREHYVTLKAQLNDDKKAIFSKCHEMWENENKEVRALYERKALEEHEGESQNDVSVNVSAAMETLDSTQRVNNSWQASSPTLISPRSMYMTNRSLNLESAVKFASLIAAYHIDTATRDRHHLDLSKLIEKAMVFSDRLEEI
jgi:hypothetical protein